ncbi:hypothetical protein M1329_00495 [Candidatus Marsarchaeota archaeon]|nr:hypothetical protein [Candidatus Marsarchaeota archaeon]
MNTSLHTNNQASDYGRAFIIAMKKANIYKLQEQEAIKHGNTRQFVRFLRKESYTELRAAKKYVKGTHKSDPGTLLELARINDAWTSKSNQYETLTTGTANRRIETLKADGLLTVLQLGGHEYYHLSDAGQAAYRAFMRYVPSSTIEAANEISLDTKILILNKEARKDTIAAYMLALSTSTIIVIESAYDYTMSPHAMPYASLALNILLTGRFIGGIIASHIHDANQNKRAAEGVAQAAAEQEPNGQ